MIIYAPKFQNHLKTNANTMFQEFSCSWWIRSFLVKNEHENVVSSGLGFETLLLETNFW